MKNTEHNEASEEDLLNDDELNDDELNDDELELEQELQLTTATKVGVTLWTTLVVVVVGTLLVVLAQHVAGWIGASEMALVVAYVGLILVVALVLSNISLNRDVLTQARLMALLLHHQRKRDARSKTPDRARSPEGRPRRRRSR